VIFDLEIKMQLICVAFVDLNSIDFAYSMGIECQIYVRFAETHLLSVNATILTNQINRNWLLTLLGTASYNKRQGQ